MQKFSNILLIAGTGRNTGKTTLACSIIQKFSNTYTIIGLKISPHFHGETEGLITLYENPEFNIYEETSTLTGKDSALMLKAGASKVFYIETKDDHLFEAFKIFQKITNPSHPLVCESPALKKYIEPGVFFIVDNERNQNKKKDIILLKEKADMWIDTDDIQDIIKKIYLTKDTWQYNQ